MTRSELVEALAAKKRIPLSQADRIIDEIFESMAKTLVAGGRIEIRGFGSIENREYNGRSGRNPRTGEMVTVKPKKSPFFKVGKELRERLMEG